MLANDLLDQMLTDSINGSLVLLSVTSYCIHSLIPQSDCPSMNLKCNTIGCEIDFGFLTRTNCFEGGASGCNLCPLKFNRMHFNFNSTGLGLVGTTIFVKYICRHPSCDPLTLWGEGVQHVGGHMH